MKIKMHLINTFTHASAGGNPTAVIITNEWLSDECMLKISQKTGFSETVFFQNTGLMPELRFWTPTQEVNACFHGTMAAVFQFAKSTLVKTKAGIYKVIINGSNRIEIEIPTAEIRSINLKSEIIAQSLNLRPEDFENGFEPVIASIGTPKLLVQVGTLRSLWGMKPNMNSIKELNQTLECRGVYVFTFDCITASGDIHARQFNPLSGINEDPATGIAAGALIAYLKEKNAFQICNKETVTIEQGYIMNHPSLIIANTRVAPYYIGGYCTYLETVEADL